MAVSLRELLRVRPGPVALGEYDTRATPGAPGDKDHTRAALDEYADGLEALQERLFAEGTQADASRSVVLVLQGMDTSGKSGTIKRVVGVMNPQGLHVASFKQPTKEELAHHFLWRVRRQLPRPGIVGIFDRSHYEDVLIVRVHELVPRAAWQGRYAEINDFEAELADSGVTLIKVFLHISYDEQRERQLARLADPTKWWKFDPHDLDERSRWADYQRAYEVVLEECSTAIAPWYVVPADRKWYRDWAVAGLIVETLTELDPQYPQPRVDVEAQRARLAPPN